MERGKVSVGGILFVMMTTPSLGAVDAFASQEFIMNQRARDQAEAEELLTFRIEAVELQSASRCAADPKMASDERLLDPQLPACDAMKNLARHNPIEGMKTEESISNRERRRDKPPAVKDIDVNARNNRVYNDPTKPSVR